MAKNKLLFLFCLFVSLSIVVGCCNNGSSDEYSLSGSGSGKDPVYHDVTNGEYNRADGLSFHADQNTFSSRAVIRIEERDFNGAGSKYLTNAAKIYRVIGVMVSDNPLVEKYEINNVDQPVTLNIPNSINGDVEAYYIGVRDNEKADWSFHRENEITSADSRMSVDMVRAATSGISFPIKTTRLNIDFALFAKVRGSDKLVPVTTVDAINTTVEAANGDEGKIPVEKDEYTDNLKVNVEVGGKNVDSLNCNDYQVEITYLNNDSNIDKIAGTSAQYPTPTYNPGLASGKNWVHTVIVNDLTGSGNKLNFNVNTKGLKTNKFPQNFTVNLKNKNTLKDVLPFEYSENLKVETVKDGQPAAPKDVMASADVIKKGDTVKLTWKAGMEPSEDDESNKGVTFSIAMAKDNGEEQIVAQDLTETEWTSEPLEIGSYTCKVIAVNRRGFKTESEAVSFEAVDSVLSTPVMEELKSAYALGETVTFKWAEVKDPFGNAVTYKVVISGGSLTENIEQNVGETTWNINTLGVGAYTAKIIANNGEVSSESRAYEFNVKSGIPSAPVFNEYASVYKVGDPVLLSWKASVDPFNKPLTYDLYLYTDTPGTPVEAGISSTMWLSYTLATGTYSIKLVVSNGTESNETIVTNAFTIMTSSRATLAGTEGSVYATGVSAVRPEFFVELNESNHDENEFRNAVVVGGIDASEVTKELIAANKLKISFNNDLSYGQSYSISMNAINDKYDNAITPFNAQEFKVVNFPGKGTEAEPFIPAADGVYMTADTKLALISGIKAEVGSFKDMVFANGIINADDTTLWSNCSVSNVNDNPVVEIPETDLWEANKTNMNVVVTFDGTIEGKTYKFATADKTYSTESGAVISIGDGSEAKPYLVYTPGQFDDVRNYISDSLKNQFKQLRNIDLAGYTSATCNESTGLNRLNSDCNFNGIYDGCNHVIKNLKMVSSHGDNALFYGLDDDNAAIKNLTLEDCYIEGSGSWNATFIAECNNGHLINCKAKNATIIGGGGQSAGLVGRIYKGSIIGCELASGAVLISNYSSSVGGIAGYISGSNRTDITIKNCTVTDSIIQCVGGYMGGLLGQLSNTNCIEDCHVINTKVIGGTNSLNVGGLIGYFYNASVSDCSVEVSTIEGKEFTGGFIGDVNGCDSTDYVKDSHFTGSVKGTGQLLGGFFGYNNGLNTENCYVELTETIEGTNNIAGFSGHNSCSYCNDCWAKVKDVIGPDGNTGGFIGNISSGKYNNCHVEADSVTSSSSYTGGFGGYNSSQSITSCYASVRSVTGGVYVGGFIGNNGGKIKDCYVKAESVTGVYGDNHGGFAGYASWCDIENCYSTCTVSSTSALSGLLVGGIGGGAKFENCFTNQTPGEKQLFGDVDDSSSTAGSVSLPGGYDSSLGWDDTIWDLSKALPTLK